MKNIIFLLCLLTLSPSLMAQISIKDKIKNQTHNRADRKADEGVSEGLDSVEDGMKSIFKKKNKDEEGQDDDQQNEENVESKKEKSKIGKTSDALTSYTKYDFVPGDQVLFFEDFSQDAIGDFPALWTTNGSGEIRTTNLYPGKFLYMNSTDNVYNLMKDLTLPVNYILEFDVIPSSMYETNEGSHSFYMSLYKDDDDFLNDDLYPGKAGVHLTLSNSSWDVKAYSYEVKNSKGEDYDVSGGSELAPVEPQELNHVIIWVQNRRMRIYHKGQKVLDMPTLLPEKMNINRLRYSLWSQDGHPYISNIRFTTAAPDMRSKLLTEGKLTSYGIYFDINSDKVKPESYGSIKQIADILNENPDVNIKIIGHTDADGDDTKNLDLSKRRAAAVKTELVKSFNVNESRIQTDGKGESEPIQNNNTSEGKAKNRRVEFLKI